MTTQPLSFVHRFADAFATRDVENIVALFTPDATYHDLFYGPFVGHAGLRELFGRMYSEGTYHHWTLLKVVVGADCTIAEWSFEFTLSDVAPTGAGRTLRFPGASVFETRDGRCHTYREYFDRAAALLAVGIAPGSVAGIVRRRPTVWVSEAESEALIG